MTEFRVEVVKLTKVLPLPNSDRLDITYVHGDGSGNDGYPVIAQRGVWKEGDLAVYVPQDALCDPKRPEFSFLVPEPKREAGIDDEEWMEIWEHYRSKLEKPVRIQAKRLRGTFSVGILIPLPTLSNYWDGPPFAVGDDMQAWFSVGKHDPEAELEKSATNGGKLATGTSMKDPGFMPYYDLEGLRKYQRVFTEGEPVYITSKLHGCNARFCFKNGKLWVASHKMYKRPPQKMTLWQRVTHPVRRVLGKTIELVLSKLLAFCVGLSLWLNIDWLGVWAVAAITKLGSLLRHVRPQLIERPLDVWWQAAKLYDLETKLARIPDIAVYGEIFANTQKGFRYGTDGTQPLLRVFDMYDTRAKRWLDYEGVKALLRLANGPMMPATIIVSVDGMITPDALKDVELPMVLADGTKELEMVPILYHGPYSLEKVKELADAPEDFGGVQADHVREGVVVRAEKERAEPGARRAVLKFVSEAYLEGKAAKKVKK